MEEKIHQHMKDLALLNSINNAVNRGDSLQKVIRFVCREIKKLFSAFEASLFLVDENNEYLEMQDVGLPASIIYLIEKLTGAKIAKKRIPLTGDSIYEETFQTGKPQLLSYPSVLKRLIADIARTEPFADQELPRSLMKRIPEIYRILNIQSVIFLPLISETETIGVMSVSARRQFTESDLERLDRISQHLTANIKHKQYEEMLARRLKCEKLVSRISSRFVGISDLDRSINASLKDIGIFCRAGRACLFLFRENGSVMDNTHEWCACGVSPQMTDLRNLSTKMFSWWMTGLNKGEPIYIADVSRLPAEANAGKEILNARDIKSLLVLPLRMKDELSGFIGVANVWKTEHWRELDSLILCLRVTSEIIGNALERKKAEEALRESEERFRSLTESTSDWIWEVDAGGTYTYSSPKVKDLLGYEPGEVIGKTPFALVPPAEAERVQAEFRAILESRKPFAGLENVNLHRDGRLVVLETSGIPFFDLNGRFCGYRGIDRDITLRKKTEKEILRQKEFLNVTIESLPHPFIVIDVNDYEIKIANSAARDRIQSKETTCYALTHNRDKPCGSSEHPCPLEEMRKAKKPVAVEHIHYDEDGDLRNVEIHAYPVFDSEGNLIRMIEYTLDITEQKKLENRLKKERERAERADKLKSIFLANMSHEIRTPLNSIIGFTDLVLSSENISEENKNYLRNSKESGNLLLSLINDILDLSRIEAGQLHIEEIACSLESILDTVGSNGRVLISSKGKNISIRESRPPNINTCIIGDPIRLEQAMNNLLSNAVKFTKTGFIEYGISLKEENTLEFYVRDTGMGIPEEKQQMIFEPFRQAYLSTSRKYGGTGLGLAITMKLIELMGGKLDLHSRVGEGSTFYFQIPYRPTEVPEPEKAKEPIIREEKTGWTILVAEDNAMNQLVVRKILEKNGYTVAMAADGRDAVSKYKTDPAIDLILMDVRMPLLDGLKATQVIRDIEREGVRKKMPIIALTASAMKGDEQKCLSAGCDAYLTKPLDKDLLIAAISKYLPKIKRWAGR